MRAPFNGCCATRWWCSSPARCSSRWPRKAGPILRVTLAAADRYLAPLFSGASAPDTLVLGCTHFPVLAAAIRKSIGTSVALVDSAETTAEAVAAALDGKDLGSEPGRIGSVRFFATDSPERFARVGEIFLGRPIDPQSVELVDLLAD